MYIALYIHIAIYTHIYAVIHIYVVLDIHTYNYNSAMRKNKTLPFCKNINGL